MRKRTSLIAAGALLVQALGLATPVQAADPVVVPFSYTGAEQIFDTPADVHVLHVVVVGASGGSASGSPGGRGARLTGDLAVTPGTRLYIEVGGEGIHAGSTEAAGGFNGGGAGGTYSGIVFGWTASGGGASDIRTLPRTNPASLESRLIVAGGGGGAGIANESAAGGHSGAAGAGSGGGAGTASDGGAGGSGAIVGAAGGFGQGGAGAGGVESDGAGGGGGGGYYGGGGGGAAPGGGGGGGSSFSGGASNVSVEVNMSGTASVTITYSVGELGTGDSGSDSGTVDAVVTMAASAVCLELSTTSIDFGTRQFGDVGAAAAPAIGITNCGGVSETILARGTDASGVGPSAWSLVSTGSCIDETLGIDAYRLRLENQATDDQVNLGTTNTTLQTLAGGASASHEALIDTPCPGSSGAGVVMAMQIVFVATE